MVALGLSCVLRALGSHGRFLSRGGSCMCLCSTPPSPILPPGQLGELVWGLYRPGCPLAVGSVGLKGTLSHWVKMENFSDT